MNAFLERKGTRVLLLMTEGLRDAYSIARHDRKELYAIQYRKPERLVPRQVDVSAAGLHLVCGRGSSGRIRGKPESGIR